MFAQKILRSQKSQKIHHSTGLTIKSFAYQLPLNNSMTSTTTWSAVHIAVVFWKYKPTKGDPDIGPEKHSYPGVENFVYER